MRRYLVPHKLLTATICSLTLGCLTVVPATVFADDTDAPMANPPADSAIPTGPQAPGLLPPLPVIGNEAEFGIQATWAMPTAAALQAEILKLAEERSLDKQTMARLKAVWPAGEVKLDQAATLDLVAQAIGIIEPAAGDLLKLCSQHRSELALPEFAVLSDDKQPTFIRNNLRLIYGRWLSQERYYEESMVTLADLDPKLVADPAALLFFQSVNYHALLFKAEGEKTLAKLFERRGELPRRYELLGRMMQLDLQALKEDSLDHVSRRMNDIRRRLEFGRTGKKVQGEEKKVIAALDKLIEELEKEQQGQGGGGGGAGGGGQGQGGGPPNGIQSGGPASESQIARGKGPGDVNKKNIGSKSGWGELPPKEREEALQQIGKEFPSHYREVIEEFFRRQAEAD